LKLTTLDTVGYIAAFCTTAGFVPQLLHIYRKKSAEDVSIGMFVLFAIGLILWLVFGFWIKSAPVILTNAVSLAFALTIFILKIRYDGLKRRKVKQ